MQDAVCFMVRTGGVGDVPEDEDEEEKFNDNMLLNEVDTGVHGFVQCEYSTRCIIV